MKGYQWGYSLHTKFFPESCGIVSRMAKVVGSNPTCVMCLWNYYHRIFGERTEYTVLYTHQCKSHGHTRQLTSNHFHAISKRRIHWHLNANMFFLEIVVLKWPCSMHYSWLPLKLPVKVALCDKENQINKFYIHVLGCLSKHKCCLFSIDWCQVSRYLDPIRGAQQYRPLMKLKISIWKLEPLKVPPRS